MIDFADFEIDPILAEQGAWLDMGRGARVKIGRNGSRRFRETVARLLKENAHRAVNGAFPEDVQEELTLRAVSEAIVLDWEGFTLNGEPLPYSPENAYRVLSNPRMEELRERWLNFSLDVSKFREQQLELDAKK